MNVRHYDNAVDGFCPMGCGETLYRTYGGRVECSEGIDCPDEAAVTKILSDPITEHLVQVGNW